MTVSILIGDVRRRLEVLPAESVHCVVTSPPYFGLRAYGTLTAIRTVPATVLDPFLGSGTTAMVAHRLSRQSIGIELNPDFAAMARRRIVRDSPLFGDVIISDGDS